MGAIDSINGTYSEVHRNNVFPRGEFVRGNNALKPCHNPLAAMSVVEVQRVQRKYGRRGTVVIFRIEAPCIVNDKEYPMRNIRQVHWQDYVWVFTEASNNAIHG